MSYGDTEGLSDDLVRQYLGMVSAMLIDVA
jgi:hypothetical protein